MTATEELRQMLDERGVEWMPSVWSAKDETFYKVGEVGYLATELSSGKMKVGIEGYLAPEQAIDATLGRGTCSNVGYYIDGTRFKCSACGYNGWTVRELAVRSGVHANTINNYLRGNNEPTLRKLIKLRDAFGCTWDELLG